MQIHSSYIDTYTNTRKVTERRRAREKEISSHKEKNEAIIQWYWTAGWPENQYHHTSSSPPPFLLLFLLLHQSPLSFHPPNFTRFPPLLLFTPLFFLFLHILLFQHHPKITRKTSPFYNKCTWEILDIQLAALFPTTPTSSLLSPSSVHILLWNRSGWPVLMKLQWVLIWWQLWTLEEELGWRMEGRWKNGWTDKSGRRCS